MFQWSLGEVVGILYRKHVSKSCYVLLRMDDGSFELVSVNGQTVRPTSEEQEAGTKLTMVENVEILEICITFAEPCGHQVPDVGQTGESAAKGHASITLTAWCDCQ